MAHNDFNVHIVPALYPESKAVTPVTTFDSGIFEITLKITAYATVTYVITVCMNIAKKESLVQFYFG